MRTLPNRPRFRHRLAWQPGPRFERALRMDVIRTVEWEWTAYRSATPMYYLSGYFGDRIWKVYENTVSWYVHTLYADGTLFELRSAKRRHPMIPATFVFSVRQWERCTEYERGMLIECRYPVPRPRERIKIAAGTPIPKYFTEPDEFGPSV